MIYNVFLCDFDDETLIRSYFNDIVSDLATFTFVSKDGSYDTSLRPADTITVYTALVDATANYADNSVVVTFVAGDTRKKFVNKLFKTILYNLDVDVGSVLYDNRFNGWVRTNYPAAIYALLDRESKSLDNNELFSGSSDFMELFYKYQANLLLTTPYVLPIFGMQMITFKNGLQVVVRTGEEKNIALIGNGTVITVYSYTINPEVEYEYVLENNKENENDVITFSISGATIIDGLNIGNTYSDNEGTVGITSVATVSISDMTIEPLTYYYDDFSGGTINCDNDIVSDVKDRYFSIGTTPHKVTGGIELIGASTIFIRSYKYKDADIKMYINPVASDTEFNIHFMKQVASTDVGVYNGHYVNIELNPPIAITSPKIVATGQGTNSLAWSDDGIDWHGLGSSIFSLGQNVIYNGSIWVATGYGDNTLAWSNDGLTWNGLGKTIFSSYGHGIAWNGSLFVACGEGTNALAWSDDGKIWHGLGLGIFSGGGTKVVWNGSIFVAGGSGANATATSTNGIDWVGGGLGVLQYACIGIVWDGTKFVAGGPGINTLAWSTNGIDWNGLGHTIFSGYCSNIAYNGTMFVATGSGSVTLAYSYNGIDWVGLGNTIFSDAGYEIAWNGSMWIAMGSGYQNSIATSINGIDWTKQDKTIFSSFGYGIAYKDELYSGLYWNAPSPPSYATYHRYILGSDSASTPIAGLTYPINTSHIFRSTIKDGVLTFTIDGDTIFTSDVDSPYPEIYDYGYIGIENKTAEKSLIVSKIEINGDEKFGRGIQVGRYIDDFDYNSEGEYR